MSDIKTLSYPVQSQLDLNRSYMPFITNGGIFVPTTDQFSLGDVITLELQIPNDETIHKIEGKVVWITPQNALNNIYPGIGIQFTGSNAKGANELLKKHIDSSESVGSYAYGTTDEEDAAS